MRGPWKNQQKKSRRSVTRVTKYSKKTTNLHDLEFIPRSRGSAGSRGSGVRSRGSEPPFHARRGPGWRELKQTPSNEMCCHGTSFEGRVIVSILWHLIAYSSKCQRAQAWRAAAIRFCTRHLFLYLFIYCYIGLYIFSYFCVLFYVYMFGYV